MIQTKQIQAMTLTKTMTATSNSKIALILAAAGSSTRMGMGCKKEYLPLEEGTVISTALKAFLKVFTPHKIIITVPKDDNGECLKALQKDKSLKNQLNNLSIDFVCGGNSRQESVYNALVHLNSLSKIPDLVLIHDGARPYVSQDTIQNTINATIEYGAAVPYLTPTDTQKIIDSNGIITKHLERKTMAAVQTPQGFIFEKLLNAHKTALQDKKEYTDDTEIWGKYQGAVKAVPGNPENIKITYAKDYQKENTMNISQIRTGLGYDLHRLVEGRKLILGGVTFDFEKGEDGHSDGDVLLHAITDALLGASGLGDIGSYFPPEDPKWKDADSKMLLKTVWGDIKKQDWNLINLDCVIKLEKPKFLPKRQEVINSIAATLEEPNEKIFVKAKTGEKLDSVGKGDAVEVWCTCLLSK